MIDEDFQKLEVRIANLEMLHTLELASLRGRLASAERINRERELLAKGPQVAADELAKMSDDDAANLLNGWGTDAAISVLAKMPASRRAALVPRVTGYRIAARVAFAADERTVPRYWKLQMAPGRGWSRGSINVSASLAAKLKAAGFDVTGTKWNLPAFAIGGSMIMTQRQLDLVTRHDPELAAAMSDFVSCELMALAERINLAIQRDEVADVGLDDDLNVVETTEPAEARWAAMATEHRGRKAPTQVAK
jgi:hypothetical protein